MDRYPFPLVTAVDGEPRASSEVIARGVKSQHASVIKLVRRHQASLEGFGTVRFEIRPRAKGAHGGGDVEFALLNETQASAILTLMRNSPTSTSPGSTCAERGGHEAPGRHAALAQVATHQA